MFWPDLIMCTRVVLNIYLYTYYCVCQPGFKIKIAVIFVNLGVLDLADKTQYVSHHMLLSPCILFLSENVLLKIGKEVIYTVFVLPKAHESMKKQTKSISFCTMVG